MDVLILGGQNPRHYKWVRQLSARLEPVVNRVEFIDYENWSNSQSTLNRDYEIEKITSAVNKLSSPYTIIAKSIGTVLTLKAISVRKIQPANLILLGIPLEFFKRQPELVKALQLVSWSTVVQNSGDPLGNAKIVFDYFHTFKIDNCTYKSLPAQTHDYLDFDLIANILLERP
jgi:predicted alpha/beta hydrolase family esterase